MNAHRSHPTQDLHLLANPAVWLCALAATFVLMSTAQAATTPDELSAPSNVESMTPRQAYEHDKAFCNSDQVTQSRARCLDEASRAYREARAGRLETGLVAQADGATTTSTSGTSRARSDRN